MDVKANGYRSFKLNPEMHRFALNEGKGLTRWLEEQDPSEQYANDPLLRGTDAFERQLHRAGIHTSSNPAMGMWASRVQDFYRDDPEIGNVATLFPEFVIRKYRQAALGRLKRQEEIQKRFYMSNSPVSDVLKPDYISSVVRQKQIEPPVPLDQIVAFVSGIDGDVYKAFFLTDSEESRTMRRSPEGTPIPTATLTGSDHTVYLHKYGRTLEASYESIRRMRIDRFALHLGLIAVQVETDKVSTGVYTLINGDGNSSTSATSYNLSTLDSDATTGTPTVKSYLAWRMKWPAPYNMNTFLATEAETLKFLMMDTGSANNTFWQMFGLYGIGAPNFQNNPFSAPFAGWTSDVTANTWLGLDNNWGLEYVTEIGSELVETDRLIRSQFEQIVISEVVGWAVFDAQACRLMVTNA